MKAVAMITARGGSKRIPRKNIKDFAGKPIIAYSIEAAIMSGLFAEVMVSTDDREIAEIAASYGAKVPFMRSAQNSGDHATTADVINEVLSSYQQANEKFDWLCCIYPTAPFITAERLQQCVSEIKNKKAKGLIPVVRFSYPPQRSFIINEDSMLEYKWPENINKRSQDLQALYHDAGQFYFADVECFLAKQSLVFHGTIPYILPESEVQDIDNSEDWEIAEMKFKLMQNCSSKDCCK